MIKMKALPNITAVVKALAKQQKRNENKLKRGLLNGGRLIQRESQKIVPILTSALKNSARTSQPEQTGKHEWEVRITYGTEYAVFVHEDLNAKHAPGKSAKYLEIPLRNNVADIKRAIREGARE